MDVKIAKDCYIPKEKVRNYSSYEYNWVKSMVRDAKKQGIPVFNYTAGKAIATVIFLDDGSLYLVNTSTATINARMDPGGAAPGNANAEDGNTGRKENGSRKQHGKQ